MPRISSWSPLLLSSRMMSLSLIAGVAYSEPNLLAQVGHLGHRLKLRCPPCSTRSPSPAITARPRNNTLLDKYESQRRLFRD
ncbi:hypothetical protein LZ32DRAFT_603029 [Colletotrichum eremochloae]|nr:hypothetical protein LZ32DRAFT_603029 [Colletotrichum eremochloae]